MDLQESEWLGDAVVAGLPTIETTAAPVLSDRWVRLYDRQLDLRLLGRHGSSAADAQVLRQSLGMTLREALGLVRMPWPTLVETGWGPHPIQSALDTLSDAGLSAEAHEREGTWREGAPVHRLTQIDLADPASIPQRALEQMRVPGSRDTLMEARWRLGKVANEGELIAVYWHGDDTMTCELRSLDARQLSSDAVVELVREQMQWREHGQKLGEYLVEPYLETTRLPDYSGGSSFEVWIIAEHPVAGLIGMNGAGFGYRIGETDGELKGDLIETFLSH